MKDKIKKILEISKKNKLVPVILIIIIGLFYWYEIRPTIIKKNCAQKVTNVSKEKSLSIPEYEFSYNWCQHLKGI